jgi:hypothetical protein
MFDGSFGAENARKDGSLIENEKISFMTLDIFGGWSTIIAKVKESQTKTDGL